MIIKWHYYAGGDPGFSGMGGKREWPGSRIIDIKRSGECGLSGSSESIQGNKHFYSAYYRLGTMPLPHTPNVGEPQGLASISVFLLSHTLPVSLVLLFTGRNSKHDFRA